MFCYKLRRYITPTYAWNNTNCDARLDWGELHFPRTKFCSPQQGVAIATATLPPAGAPRDELAVVQAVEEPHDPWLGGNSDLLLSRSSSFMFMAASSAARYLNTYGIATVSIPLLVLQAWHDKFFAGLTVDTRASRAWLSSAYRI